MTAAASAAPGAYYSKVGPDLVAALNELGHVGKDATGHHGTYSSLGHVLNTVKPILAKHNLAVQQQVDESEPGFVTVSTRLWHTTGVFISDSGLRMPVPNDPQKVGGAISYCRRYGLTCFLGLGGDPDDDGQGASDQIRREEEVHPNSKRVADVHAALAALGPDEKTAVKAWADGRSLSGAHLLDDDDWLGRVEAFLTEMTGS